MANKIGISVKSEPHNTYVSSDYFLNNPGEFSFYKEMGDNIIPVDEQGGFVPIRKHDPANIKNSQLAMQRRYGLGTGEGVETEDGF